MDIEAAERRTINIRAAIAGICNGSLKEVSMVGWNIDDGHVCEIADGLASSTCGVEILRLNHNKISGIGARALSDGITKNNTLKELYIYGNPLGVSGRKCLKELLSSDGHCVQRIELSSDVQTMDYGHHGVWNLENRDWISAVNTYFVTTYHNAHKNSGERITIHSLPSEHCEFTKLSNGDQRESFSETFENYLHPELGPALKPQQEAIAPHFMEGDLVRIHHSVSELRHGWGRVDRNMIGCLKKISDQGDEAVVDFEGVPGFPICIDELELVGHSRNIAKSQHVEHPVYSWERADGDEFCSLGDENEGFPLWQVRGDPSLVIAEWVRKNPVIEFDRVEDLRTVARELERLQLASNKKNVQFLSHSSNLDFLKTGLRISVGCCTILRLQNCGLGAQDIKSLGLALASQPNLKVLDFSENSLCNEGVSLLAKLVRSKICPELEILSTRAVHMTYAGAEQVFQCGGCLSELDVGQNHLSDHDMGPLILSYVRGSTRMQVNLKETKISQQMEIGLSFYRDFSIEGKLPSDAAVLLHMLGILVQPATRSLKYALRLRLSSNEDNSDNAIKLANEQLDVWQSAICLANEGRRICELLRTSDSYEEAEGKVSSFESVFDGMWLQLQRSGSVKITDNDTSQDMAVAEVGPFKEPYSCGSAGALVG